MPVGSSIGRFSGGSDASSISYWGVVLSAETKREIPGNDLLSHPVARAVPSALVGLTAVFGMGTGVSPPLWSPDISLLQQIEITTSARSKAYIAFVRILCQANILARVARPF